MRQINLGIIIQVLNSFVTGTLLVILPLMMQERSIDIVTMGLVFASMPLIFQIGRMLFAIISDFWGRKLFFFLSGCLGILTSSIYFLAYTPLEFVFGKVMEGIKSSSLWAVNRAFFLENSSDKWRALVKLRTTTYVSSAFGSLLAGFFVAQFYFEGTILLCAILFTLAIPLSLFLEGTKRKPLNVLKAMHALDPRKKKRIFKICLVSFFAMGLSFGFASGFVYPLFLSYNGFTTETIGLILGLQVLLAGLVSYFFAGRFKVKELVSISGILYTCVLIAIGFSSSILAGILVISYGFIEGLLSIGQEGILSKIANKESYGTDIGLLWMGTHIGRTLSLALTGLIISRLGVLISFLTSAIIMMFFYVPSFLLLEE